MDSRSRLATGAATGQRAHAAIVGYQGYWNVGDEAVLVGIESVLAECPIEIKTIFCGPAGVAAFPRAKRVHLRRLLPTPATIRSLRSVDWLILGGGGLLNDYWMRAIPRYLTWILAARLAGTGVLWLGIGVGPVRRRPLRMLANLAGRLSSLVTVRDDESRRLVSNYPLRFPVHVVPDHAFFIPATETNERRSGIALVLRPPAPSDVARGASLAAAWSGVAEALLRADYGPVTLMTMGGTATQGMAGQADATFIDAVRELVTRQVPDADLRSVELAPQPAEAMRVLASYDAVVTMRLHGLILSSIAGTPCVPVAYDPKVAAAARLLGLGPVTLSLDDVTWPRVKGSLAAVSSELARTTTARALEGLQAGAVDVRNLINEAMLQRPHPRR